MTHELVKRLRGDIPLSLFEVNLTVNLITETI